jgi:hypothetical protein
MALTIESGHILVMTLMDIVFGREAMRQVDPIERPQILEFLLSALIMLYYGRIEEIYELSFHGSKPLNPVIFKCHWFDPEVTRRTYSNLGLVEVRQDSVLLGDDVYIVAQQAIQVYYLPYACQTKEHLKGWYIVHKVSPHGKVPIPIDEDYKLDPNTYDGELRG